MLSLQSYGLEECLYFIYCTLIFMMLRLVNDLATFDAEVRTKQEIVHNILRREALAIFLTSLS